jgi:uncharacterized protein
LELTAIGGRILLGLLVGVLVGLTGLGGGMVLLPLLISVLGVPPIVAVGSDAAINFVTKIGAGTLHWRRGNVNWRLVFNLGCGSIPGAIVGVTVLARVRAAYGSGVNDFLRIAIGVLLVIIPLAYVSRFRSSGSAALPEPVQPPGYRFGIVLIGFFAGTLVGLTSIGSGSVILMLLLVFYRFVPSTMVGTDIAHAVFLAALTSVLQYNLGNVDIPLVFSVLLGSVPGGVLGAYLTNRVASGRLRQILCGVLMVVGARMVWGAIAHAK